MGWTSLSSRKDSLPLVLAGPIVRKTTSTSVSVWIALKEPSDLELIITETSSREAEGTGSASTISFGEMLHVAVITVTGLDLLPDTLYSYDIRFGPDINLNSIGTLSKNESGISKITYLGQTLPSFLLPSFDMQKLKIVHASCRKPHGGDYGSDELDGFVALDSLLEQTLNNTDARPQQLYLTGDQIYADDVHDLLLFMLMDAGKELLKWTIVEKFPSNPPPQQPLHRKKFVASLGFTSGEADSHLLRLGEFYSMYLFVWSNELWPEDIASYPQFNPEYKSYTTDNEEKYNETTYKQGVDVLLKFQNSLPKVRKALANIPVYMMFDDHEITDDWYLNREWFEDVNSKDSRGTINDGITDGNRIIQNGLSAFAIFQAWGNTPDKFNVAGSNEKTLLEKLKKLNDEGGLKNNTWAEIKNLVIPRLSGDNLEGGIDWDYSFSFSKFYVIVLNTRTNRHLANRSLAGTKREIRKKHNLPGLLSPNAINSQIKNRLANISHSHEFTLVIAPAPVFGLRIMEGLVQPAVEFFTDAFKGDVEAWIADKIIFENVLKELALFKRILILSGDVHYSFSTGVDYWLGEKGPAEKKARFVNLTASSLKNSAGGPIPLSNAVNYQLVQALFPSFEYYQNHFLGWNAKGEYIKAEIILYSADTKEELDRMELSYKVDKTPNPHVWHLEPNSKNEIRTRLRNIFKGKNDTIIEIEKQWFDDTLKKPDWQYSIRLYIDRRKSSVRKGDFIPPTPISLTDIGQTHQDSNLGHTLIGENSIGEISFRWGVNEEDKKVLHKIWSKKNATEKFPFTVHIVDFGIVGDTVKRPSEIGKLP